jgi:hypothetical protein
MYQVGFGGGQHSTASFMRDYWQPKNTREVCSLYLLLAVACIPARGQAPT